MRNCTKSLRSYNILLVDDEAFILKSLKRSLLEEEKVKKYNIFTAQTPAKALEIMKAGKFHLVISDQQMPDMPGNKFLELVRAGFSDTIRIMLTGQASLEVAIKAINEGRIYRFLTKPWDNFELAITVSQALNQYDLEAKNRYLLKKVNQQACTFQLLEQQHPGITKIKSDDEGTIMVPDLDKITDQELNEIIAQFE